MNLRPTLYVVAAAALVALPAYAARGVPVAFGWQPGDHAKVTASLFMPKDPGDPPDAVAREEWTLDVRSRAGGLEVVFADVDGRATFPADLTPVTLPLAADGHLLAEGGTREARRLWTLFVERWIGTYWLPGEQRVANSMLAAPGLGWRVVRTASADSLTQMERCGERRRPLCAHLDTELVPDPDAVREGFATLLAAHPEAGEGTVAAARVDTMVYVFTEPGSLRLREASVSEATSVTMVGGGSSRRLVQALYDFSWR